jgi:predicted metal-binding protein
MEFTPELLVPEQRIRELCFENKCGNYRNNYMCPPHVGSVEEAKARLKPFRRGMLLQFSRSLDVKDDYDGVMQTKMDFHNKILQLEEFSRDQGVQGVWGMMGGNCELCRPCKAELGEPCSYPDKARMSLESIAIDVLSLLDRLGLDNKFHPDKITWTGCVLF